MTRTITLALFLALTLPARAGDLKPTRIALFNSGVGYFEAATSVEGVATAELTFRVEQINDILKSLVLRDLDGGTIAAVQYPSRDPIEKTLRSFGVDITGKPTLGNLLDQLRGIKVEIQSVQPITGSIFGVEKRKSTTEHGGTTEREFLTLLTADGLRSFDLESIAGVKILDAKVDGELQKALAALALAHDADKKSVTLNFNGQGKRRVNVSYILETPIWKTSYRLGLRKDAKPFLQGWAIVDNATEQDWENVNLSLVSGRPISFTMDLYQPLYIPRPEEQLALYESLRAPEYAAPVPAKIKRPAARGATADMSVLRALTTGDSAAMAQAGGQENDESTYAYDLKSNTLRPAATGVQSLATAQSAGELFEYKIAAPVTLKRQQSAMLPIVTEEIDGEKLSVWNPETHPKHPLNAIKLKNTSKLFLMQGPVTVFDDGVYAGDAKLPDLRSGDDRLVGYALDLATEVNVKKSSLPDEVTRLTIVKGVLHLTRKYVDERTYTVQNKGESAKSVILEHDTSGWELVEPKEPYEKTTSLARFKVDLPAGDTKTLTVRMETGRGETVILTGLNTDQIEFYIRMRVISEPVKKALARLIELRTALDDTRRETSRLNNEVETISTEQSRIRENMKVLSQNSDVYRRYEKKLGEQESRIEKLRTDIAASLDKERTQQKAMEEFLMSLELQ